MARTLKVGLAAAVLVLGVGVGVGGIASGSVDDKTTPAEAALIAHVPASNADSCVGYTSKVKSYLKHLSKRAAPIVKKISAAVQCFPAGVDGVLHIQFTADRALDSAYALLLARVDLEPKTAAITEGTCPIESAYGDPQAGRVGCVPSSSAQPAAEVIWESWDLKILSDAVLKDDTIGSGVFSFFQGEDSGPT